VGRRPSCPLCRKPGTFVEHDARDRAVYRCLSEDCAVVEYDREVVRLREGAVATPPDHEHTPMRGKPRWWRPKADAP
jgi:sigma54-dependent transcription regulator